MVQHLLSEHNTCFKKNQKNLHIAPSKLSTKKKNTGKMVDKKSHPN